MTTPGKTGGFLFLIKASIMGNLSLPHSLFSCQCKPFFCNALFQHRRKDMNALRCKYYQHKWINLQAQNDTQITKEVNHKKYLEKAK